MKYVILHGDGLAGSPRRDLGGKTLLQAANTPNLDAMARSGELGVAIVPAEGLVPGSDVTQVALLGYDPRKMYPGPAPLEAASLGVKVGEHDVVYRCSMVTLRGNTQQGKGASADIKKLAPPVTVEGETENLDDEDARELLEAVNEQLGSETIQFCPGTGFRHLMVWVNGKLRAACVDPREAAGRPINECLPTGDGAEMLRKLMEAALVILRDHPINDQRRGEGLKPVHGLWLWGQGRAPRWPSFTERYRVSGTIVSTSDVHRGIGLCAGLDAGDLALPRGSGGSDFLARGEVALCELAKKDFVYVHAQMPAEVVQGTDSKAAVQVVEEFDQNIAGTLLAGLARMGPHRLLVVCDAASGHREPLVPALYAVCEGLMQKGKSRRKFSEAEAEAAQEAARDATKLAAKLFVRG